MSTDFKKMTVTQLKELLKKKGLPVSGKKDELIERLEGAGEDEEEVVEESESSVEEEKPAPSKKRKAEEAPSKKEPPAKKAKTGTIKVHDTCTLSGASVVDDWGVMLNQTNVSNNNNKFYVIQLLKSGSTYYCFTAWGRVGEPGQKAMSSSSLDGCKKDFCKKFKDKTGNDWNVIQGNFDKFVTKSGKYTLIEMDHDDEAEEELEAAISAINAKNKGGAAKKAGKIKASALEKPVQELMKLIFDLDMFKSQMKKFDIDIKQMPLGKLSAAQVNKGYDCLVKLADAITAKKKSLYEELTNKFYTAIPHTFGRVRPPVIGDLETVQQKKDMLAVLGDIALAQELANKGEEEGDEVVEEAENPIDVNYKLLNCDIAPLDQESDEYEVILKYLNNTMGDYRKLKLLDVFTINRQSEGKRFSVNSGITNRKLLWHGTNVAVLVAILSTGLRIMPHSGGRVGKGIYFASENSKSAGYVGTTDKNVGFMFLNEVALGKEHHINKDDSSLVRAPPGHDCIIAKGWTEPDPSQDTTITLEGNSVVVPQGKPIKQSKWSSSSFSQSEYLVYREDQVRIRYLLKLQF